MSRYSQWGNALVGLSKTIQSFGYKTNYSNFNVEINVIKKYCKQNSIKGSLSQQILNVSKEYNQFKKYLKQENGKESI